jgi:hypothetical protein
MRVLAERYREVTNHFTVSHTDHFTVTYLDHFMMIHSDYFYGDIQTILW